MLTIEEQERAAYQRGDTTTAALLARILHLEDAAAAHLFNRRVRELCRLFQIVRVEH